MYTNWASYSDTIKDIKSLDDFNVLLYKQNGSLNIRTEIQDSIITKQNKLCQIYKWSGDKWGNHESVGYIEENKGIVLVILSARDKTYYSKSYDSFLELIKSYFFMTEEIKIEK